MKGLTHFLSGAAAATFVRAAVDGAVESQSFALVLGGIFGILPDTLDFKFAQFLSRRDVEVDPHPDRIDPGEIARTVAAAAERAVDERREVAVQLDTLPIGPDLWRQYFVRIHPRSRHVEVELGPAVSTSQVPHEIGLPDVGARGRAEIAHPVEYSYEGETTVDIFNGPSFGFRPAREGGGVEVEFLPWHRRWSHSLVLAAFLGLLTGLCFGPWAGVIAGLAYAVHVIEDQLGVMGSNLMWPLTRRRWPGLGLMHSSDALPNFAFVWLSLVLVVFNLNRFSASPAFPTGIWVPLVAVAGPIAALWILDKALSAWEVRTGGPGRGAEEAEAVDEMGDAFGG
jgi:hypothetical protein